MRLPLTYNDRSPYQNRERRSRRRIEKRIYTGGGREYIDTSLLSAMLTSIYRDNGTIDPGCFIEAKQIDRTRNIFRPRRPSQRVPASGQFQQPFTVRDLLQGGCVGDPG